MDEKTQGLEVAFRCRMITLDVRSSLEAVGFMPRVAGALAERGVSCNPVSGFHSDHVFVPEGRVGQAMDVLEGLSRGEGAA